MKKEPLIDRNVPAKERTKQQELEGIRPGIVKGVHEVAPTLKTNIPPEVQAILDQNTKSASAKATDSKPAEFVTESPQESSQNEAAATESGPTPPPPAVPPRPAGYELTDETKSTLSEQKEPQSTALSITHPPQEDGQKVSSVNEKTSPTKIADSEALAEVQTTTQPPPPVSKEEEGIIPSATSNQEDEAKDERKVDNLEKKDVSEEEQQLPEPASEAKPETQPETNTLSAAAPVCTDTICLLPKKAQMQGSTDEGKDEKTEEEVQVPPEPDLEATIPATKKDPAASTEESVSSKDEISKDDKTETVGEEMGQGDNDVQLPESVVEVEGEGMKEETVVSENLAQTADVKDDKVQKQDAGIDREPIEAEHEKPAMSEIQEEKQEEGDQSEPQENVKSAVPASEAESNEILQTRDKQAKQTQVNTGGVIDETVTATPVAMLESGSEGTDGGIAAATSETEQTSEAGQQQTATEAAEGETPPSNEAIMDSIQTTEGEEKQQLDQAPVAIGTEQECGNGIVSEENQTTTLTTIARNEALMVEEENSQSNVAAIDVSSEAEIPKEEEVKSKIPPPPPPAQEEIKRGDEGEESPSIGGPPVPPAPVDGLPLPPPPPPLPVDGLPLAPPPPPPPIDGLPLPPPPPPPPPIGVQIPKGPPKAKEVKRKAQSEKSSGGAMAYEEAMAAIRGGVRLKSVPAPAERPAGEEKVVDVASELRQKLMKQKRKEVREKREREILLKKLPSCILCTLCSVLSFQSSR